MPPHKLQHQQFVEVSIEQRSDNRVEFPVVVMRPLSKIDDHRAVLSLESRSHCHFEPKVFIGTEVRKTVNRSEFGYSEGIVDLLKRTL